MKHVPARDLPFSKVVISGNIVEVSGQIGLEETGKLEEGVENQTKRAMQNIQDILHEQGLGISNVMKVRIYLTDMDHYDKVNEIYASFFESEFPARVVVGVQALPLGAMVEIECTAIAPQA